MQMPSITNETQKEFLIIDARKDGLNPSNNLHWRNAAILSKIFNADFIWSYNGVNENIKTNYKHIIFNHATAYSFVDYKWLQLNHTAKIYYVKNEYSIGEPRILWKFCKETGRTYEVIANHSIKVSRKLNKQYVSKWHTINLNCLIYEEIKQPVSSIKAVDTPIYWGSFRGNRVSSYKKYLSDMIVSTNKPERFNVITTNCIFIPKINWYKEGLWPYKYSLYIEDDITTTNPNGYNFLANRFYESLIYNVIPIFPPECNRTIKISGYHINNWDYIGRLSEWKELAAKEKNNCIDQLKNIAAPS